MEKDLAKAARTRSKNKYDLLRSWSYLKGLILGMPSSTVKGQMWKHVDRVKGYSGVGDLEKIQESILLIENIIVRENVDHESRKKIAAQLQKVKRVFAHVSGRSLR